MITIADVAARTNALSTGEVDMMDQVDLKTVNLLKRNRNIKVETTTGYAHYTMPMRTDMTPFDNVDVRLALKLAMDRRHFENGLRGYGNVGNDHPISPANQFHASELPQRAYDPDKAKFHLKKAGYSNLTVPCRPPTRLSPAPSTPPLFTRNKRPRPGSPSKSFASRMTAIGRMCG